MSADQHGGDKATQFRIGRRTLLAGVAGVAALAPAALAQHRHDHGGGVAKGGTARAGRSSGHGRYARLAELARDCIVKGEACFKHCVAQINKGDTSLVDCLKTVTAMVPVCRTLERYAVIEAKHLKELVRLSITVNEECADECRRHADHHNTCKACEDACRACIEECRKVMQQASVMPFTGRRFALTTHEGKSWSSDMTTGQPVALVFGYTSCPDVCPTTLMELTNALQGLGDAAGRLQVLFVTVDPERDTAAHLKTYLRSFDRRIVGLTGNMAEILAMAGAFGAHVEHKQGKGTLTVDHSVSIYLLDRDGRVTDRLMPGMAPPTAISRLRSLTG